MVGRVGVLELMMIRLPITGRRREPVKKATEVPIALRERFAVKAHAPRAMIRSMKIYAVRSLTHFLLIRKRTEFMVLLLNRNYTPFLLKTQGK